MIHNYLYKADEYRTRMKVLKTKTKEEQTTLVARGVKKDRNMVPKRQGDMFQKASIRRHQKQRLGGKCL